VLGTIPQAGLSRDIKLAAKNAKIVHWLYFILSLRHMAPFMG